MEKIYYPKSVNLNSYKKDSKDLKALYGLPKNVIFCKKCLISNQRPNSAVEFLNKKDSKKETIHFDENGICDACNFTEDKKTTINWEDRHRQLKELCDKNRKNDGSYDCVVPGSGGKDSFYASHILKTKYGMHPLTVTWAPHVYTDWGWKNFQSWIHAGHDNFLMTPNGQVHRLLTRLSTELLFHPFQAFMLGQKALAPKMALMFNIPLVFYGENEAEYGNPIEDTEDARRDSSYFALDDQTKIYLGGVSIADLKSQFGLNKNDLLPYLPANINQIIDNKIEIHYLGHYLKWHPQSCYYYAVEHGGFEVSPERTPGTYSKYNSIDDRIDDLHYLTTGIKFGLGRASYDAAQEIRSGDITREEGVALAKKFDHEYPERFMDEMFAYLSLNKNEYPIASQMFENPIMDKEYFRLLSDKFRSPHLWYHKDGDWKLRRAVWKNLPDLSKIDTGPLIIEPGKSEVSELTIVMYHYVRPIKNSQYPAIKALELEGFKRQLDYLSSKYSIITAEQLIAHSKEGKELPTNACYLTFDDGLKDHFEYVMPELLKRNIQGSFFPSTNSIIKRQLLDVHAIHHILATSDCESLVIELNQECLEHGISSSKLEALNKIYSIESLLDTAEVMYVKNMLQFALSFDIRTSIISKLFKKYVGISQDDFADEFYLSAKDIQALIENGMYVGSHGDKHEWLANKSSTEQTFEIELALKNMEILGIRSNDWIMCYPYGSYNNDTLKILKSKHCKIGLTTKPGIAKLNKSKMLELMRFDCNSFPH